MDGCGKQKYVYPIRCSNSKPSSPQIRCDVQNTTLGFRDLKGNVSVIKEKLTVLLCAHTLCLITVVQHGGGGVMEV
jgi:hypothetical protein